MFAAKDTLLTRPSGGYQISRSVRLRSSASAYLNRTPASATNRKTWTWSGWVKLGNLGDCALFQAYSDANNRTQIGFGGNQINFSNLLAGSTNARINTNAVYRDPSAWYHIVAVYDSTDATSSNRMKLYVNGVQQTSLLVATYPAQNTDLFVNNNIAHYVGRDVAGSTFDGYLAEINFIDGQALTPSSFGQTNSVTGVWQPKKYAGTYGTNGFYLNFSDNSGATATTIGKDYSGNGNNWTSNNISVTAGATYDSMLDVPTPYADGGNGRGNYCVLNPLDDNTNMAPSSGNLDWVNAGATQYSTRSTIFPTSGKWYAEFTISSSAAIIAIANQSAVVQGANGLNGVFAFTTFIYNNSGTAAQSGLASFAASDVIAVAYDADTNSVQFYRNNSTYGTAVTPSATGPFCFYVGANGATCTVNANFGQRPFAYTAPSGFRSLCTQNLPTPTIGATSTTQANKYFDATLYTGNGSTQSITGVGFQPDLVWLKARSAAYGHGLFDVLRGTTKRLSSDGTGAEGTESGVTSFNSDGFTMGSATFGNNNGTTMVGWQWKANGSGSSNTSGSITSTVSANTTAGFSIVTYTGTGASGTVGHGLGVTPAMIIYKDRGAVGSWPVMHTSLANMTAAYVKLNATDAVANLGSSVSAPTSTVFGVSSSTSSATTCVAYCFAPVAGYSAFGSYTGNGSTDGPFVFTNFQPRWIMIKRTDSAGFDWNIVDTSRNTYNVTTSRLWADLSNAEDSTDNVCDITSNGFKLRSTNTNTNASGGTYIYACFASNPFKYSNAR